MAPRFIARQLAWPTGLGGWLIRLLMNRGNARLNAYALDALGLAPGQRVLEVGFGGGLILPRLLERSAFLCGVDRSADAVAGARRRFAAACAGGRAEFLVGTVEALPLPDAGFDRLVSVNTVYFWQSLAAGSGEMFRVLRPGGRAVLGFLPRDAMQRLRMPADIFTPRDPAEVVAALRGAGFAEAGIRQPPGRAWLVATAVRP